jgi:hypothetical protein
MNIPKIQAENMPFTLNPEMATAERNSYRDATPTNISSDAIGRALVMETLKVQGSIYSPDIAYIMHYGTEMFSSMSDAEKEAFVEATGLSMKQIAAKVLCSYLADDLFGEIKGDKLESHRHEILTHYLGRDIPDEVDEVDEEEYDLT